MSVMMLSWVRVHNAPKKAIAMPFLLVCLKSACYIGVSKKRQIFAAQGSNAMAGTVTLRNRLGLVFAGEALG
jgi:uncharacterized membrane protein